MSEELPSELNSITVTLTPVTESQPSPIPSLAGLVQTAEGVYSAVPYDPSKLDYQSPLRLLLSFKRIKPSSAWMLKLLVQILGSTGLSFALSGILMSLKLTWLPLHPGMRSSSPRICLST